MISILLFVEIIFHNPDIREIQYSNVLVTQPISSTAASGATKVSGRKSNQAVGKPTGVTSSSLPWVEILPRVEIHPDPGGISKQLWFQYLGRISYQAWEVLRRKFNFSSVCLIRK